jgi:hypothetical protein
MPVHLLKISVGIDDVDHLRRVQLARLEQAAANGLGPRLWHRTRHRPKRADEVLAGGSIYWIVKRFVQVRQRIVGLEPVVGDDGIERCDILLDPKLIRTVPQPRRPHQGWRYLDPDDAPRDLGKDKATGEISDGLAIELRELGLI